MSHIIKNSKNLIDINTVIYDLAKIYSEQKFRYALEHCCITNYNKDVEHPELIDETQYLLDLFEDALSIFGNVDKEQLVKNIDFTYESDSE